jgi:hypothetical protein
MEECSCKRLAEWRLAGEQIGMAADCVLSTSIACTINAGIECFDIRMRNYEINHTNFHFTIAYLEIARAGRQAGRTHRIKRDQVREGGRREGSTRPA